MGLKAAKKSIKWACFVFTAVCLAVAFTPLANRLGGPLLMAETDAKKTDLIAVLGGGAYANGVLGGASNERLIKAVLLYREGRAPRVIFTGGQVVGVASKLGHTVLGKAPGQGGPFVEAALMRDLAVGMGVAAKDCLVETESLSTYENLKNLKAFMDREGLKTATLVTSPLHMRRAAMTARRLGVDFAAAPAADATMHKTTPIARVHLMRDVAWEYLAFGLYWMRGQV